MPRIKIDLPDTFNFSTEIAIRITDLNYGGHVGNDTILSIIHESRFQFLKSKGFSELDAGGTGLIMGDVAIEFKTELFYGDTLIASVCAGDFSRVSFDFYYKLEKKTEGRNIIAAVAKTGMICYNYEAKKVSALPEFLKNKLLA